MQRMSRVVKRVAALSLMVCLLAPAAITLAARQPEAELCISVAGAPDDVTPDELREGIADGSYAITSVRPCPSDGQGGHEGPGPAGTPRPPAKGTGQWVVNPIEQDALTDDPITATWLFADGSRSAALIVECISRGVTQVRILWNVYLDLETADITTRIGDQDPVTQAWPLDTNGTSSYYPTDPLAFLATLFGQDRLVAQTQPWNRNEVTLVFPIAGVEEAVANVRTACGW
jgi:hypothetical protein